MKHYAEALSVVLALAAIALLVLFLFLSPQPPAEQLTNTQDEKLLADFTYANEVIDQAISTEDRILRTSKDLNVAWEENTWTPVYVFRGDNAAMVEAIESGKLIFWDSEGKPLVFGRIE